MSTGFLRTEGALGRRDAGGRAGIGFAAGLLVVLVTWGLVAPVPVYVRSASARVEVAGGPVALVAVEGGRVAQVAVAAGGRVAAGALLVTLEHGDLDALVDATRSRAAAAEGRAAALRRELLALAEVVAADGDAAGLGVTEARARRAAAESAAGIAGTEAERAQKLKSVVTAEDLERSLELHARRRAEADAAMAAELQASSLARARAGELAIRIEELTAALASEDAAIAQASAEERAMAVALERRRVRAAEAGVVAEWLPTRVGDVVEAGHQFGTVLPEGRPLRVVAQLPATGLGRVAAGQRGVVRLDAWPWAWFGVLDAVVVRVGEEPRDGTVRVEAALENQDAIDVRHGLTGTVDVAVARTTPLGLLLRRASVQ